MPRLPPSIHRNRLVKALLRIGFAIDKSRGNGSHYKMYSLDGKRSITIPKHLESMDTRKSIEEFVANDIGDIQKLLDEI